MVAFRTEDRFLEIVLGEKTLPQVLRMHPQEMWSGYVPAFGGFYAQAIGQPVLAMDHLNGLTA